MSLAIKQFFFSNMPFNFCNFIHNLLKYPYEPPITIGADSYADAMNFNKYNLASIIYLFFP